MPGLFVRPALPVDEKQIAELHAESWRDSYRGIMPGDFLNGELTENRRQHWREVFKHEMPGRLILSALIDNVLVGFLMSRPRPDDLACDLIDNVHVSAAHRGHCIGLALMREASDRLAAMGRRRAGLFVLEENGCARRFCQRLGGVEGAVISEMIAGHGPFDGVSVQWDNLHDIGYLARREALRRNPPPLCVAAACVEKVTGAASGADHPIEAGKRARSRYKQRLGDVFGLSAYGVNRVELAPGVWSSIPHWHTHEDEFLYVLEGEVWVISGDEERLLQVGDCAGFAAGSDRPHHLENRSTETVRLLEIGARRQDLDEVYYPGEDLRITQRSDGRRAYTRRDGTPID